MKQIIHTIEELSLNAWPALQTIILDGWVIRFANGYTRRANSINPVYVSSIDVKEKIRICEQIYRRKNLPVIFKMTQAIYPEILDSILEEEGYEIDSRVSVQTTDLFNGYSDVDVELHDRFSEEWLAGFCRMNNIGEDVKPTMRQMLGNIVPEVCFASISREDRIIACGLGVLQDGYIGLFDVVTDASFRNQGFGTRLVSNLLAWGKKNHARKAYLQVVPNNVSALHIYSRLGFREEYQYWYRVRR
jgi:N-acetylglutamate synthase